MGSFARRLENRHLQFLNVSTGWIFLVLGVAGLAIADVSKSSNRGVILELFALFTAVAFTSAIYHSTSKRSRNYAGARVLDYLPIVASIAVILYREAVLVPLISGLVWLLLAVSLALFAADFADPRVHPYWHMFAAAAIFCMYVDCLQVK